MQLAASTTASARPRATGAPDARFVELHLRFRGPLQRFFRSYRLNADDVADLTQEVFMRLGSTRCPVDLRRPDAYVFTLARNLLRDRARPFAQFIPQLLLPPPALAIHRPQARQGRVR